MSLINYTYLQNTPCVIPVFSPTSADGVGQIAYIDSLIERKQPETLKDVFGTELYDLFIAGLAETTPDTRWTTLKARIVNTSTKVSLLNYFVMVEHLNNNRSLSGEIGEFTVQAANMQRADDKNKSRFLWNIGCDMVNDLYDWMQTVTDYPEADFTGMKYFEKINSFNI